MSLVRENSKHGFKPIPEDAVSLQPDVKGTASSEKDSVSPTKDASTPQGPSTPDGTIQELRKLLTDFQDDDKSVRGPAPSLGSRPSSRCSLRSSSRPSSRLGSRRSSWARNEEEEEEVEVSSSQKANLLVVSQQRLVYTLQGLRHELSSLDEEVNRIRNDILNSRRFYNAMRGINDQPTWGSSHSNTKRAFGSGSSSPSMYSLDNSYSDDTDSYARCESCCSFTSWRSEAELFNVFREAEEVIGSDKSSTSNKNGALDNTGSDVNISSDINSSSGSSGSSGGGGRGGGGGGRHDAGTGSLSKDSLTPPVIRGRYRQLGTPLGTPRR